MIYLFENISYNHLLGIVIKGGKEFKLTKIQNKLLKYLLDNPQEVISKQVLMDQVWQRTVTENSIDQRIANLRSIVEIDRTNPKIISTNFGQGIFLNCEVEIEVPVKKTNTNSSQIQQPMQKLYIYISAFSALLILLFIIYWTQFSDEPFNEKAIQQISKQDYMNQFTVDVRKSINVMFANLPLKVRKKFRRYLTKVSDNQKQVVTLALLEMKEADRIQYILSL